MAVQKQGDQLEPTNSSSVDTGCRPGDLLETMNDREGWRERVGDIRADGATRWRDDDCKEEIFLGLQEPNNQVMSDRP